MANNLFGDADASWFRRFPFIWIIIIFFFIFFFFFGFRIWGGGNL